MYEKYRLIENDYHELFVSIMKQLEDMKRRFDDCDEDADMIRLQISIQREVVLHFDNGMYLHIRQNDDKDYAYTLYDENGKVIDSGVIERDVDMNGIYLAAEMIMMFHDVSIQEDGELISVEEFEEWLNGRNDYDR